MVHRHDEDLCKVGQVDEGVLQVIRFKTELFHGKSEESNSWLGRNLSPHPPHHPVPVEINAKRVDTGDEDVEAEVELVPVDEKGVGDVALHNYRVFLLHLLLLLCVHFDLARNLRQFVFKSEHKKGKLSELPCLGNLSRMLLYRTCCLEVSQCTPFNLNISTRS